MRIVRIALAGGCFLLAGCATSSRIRESFDFSSRQFNRMLRWQETEDACSAFADPPLVKECQARGETIRKVSMTDLRVRTLDYRDEENAQTATMKVELEYYLPNSNRVRKIEYLEKWAYREVGGMKLWRVTTLPPELK